MFRYIAGILVAIALLPSPASAQYEGTTRGMKLISDSVAQDGTWNISSMTVGTITVSTSLSIPDGTAAAPAIRFASSPNTGIYYAATGKFQVSSAGTLVLSITTNGFNIYSGLTNLTSGPLYFNGDTVIVRQAADVLGMRNGTTGQKWYVSGTYTDTNNFERGFLSAGATGLILGHEALGTGTARSVRVQSSGVSNALFSGKAQAVADATATTVLNVTVPTDGSCSLIFAFSAKTASASESQVHNGIVAFAAYEDPDAADSFFCTVSEETEHVLASAGTYSDTGTWTCVAGATTAIQESIDSSLDTASTLNLNVLQNSGCVLSIP